MAKPDWIALQQQFLTDYANNSISPKEWCESRGLKYSTAKRYIKVANSELRTANKTANSQSAQIVKSAEELIDDESLTPLQALFVLEYVKDKNATKAAERAGFSDPKYGRELLAKTGVLNAINRQLKAIATAHLITAEKVVEHMWNVATANPNELIDHRIVNCRYCHGIEHNYQWGKEEYRLAQEKAELRDKDPPDCSGGFGFDELADPNPNCPECHGRGKGRVVPHDTRKLGEKGMQLLAGVKLGKDGLEIKMHDQMKALEAVAKHLNLFTNQQTAKAPDQETPEDDGISDDYRLELKPDEATPDKPIL